MIQIDEIGPLYIDGTYDANCNETARPVLMAGWPVNTTSPVPEWAASKVTPATPRRVYGGMTTHFYTFASKAEFDAALVGVDLDPVIVPVPAAVTMRQARLALLGAGKLAAVDAAIDALSEPTKTAARIEWEYSGEVQRHNGFVSALAPALGLSAESIDQLFIAAKAL